MGCNGEYLNPTNKERDSIDICEHLVFLNEENYQHIPKWAEVGAENCYGAQKVDLDKQVETLCAILKNTHEDFIYNGRNPRARKLADWYDTHKKADESRIKEEAIQRARIAIYKKLPQDAIDAFDIKNPED
jgi:hypothetical protein